MTGMSKRLAITLASILGALIIAATVVVVVVVNGSAEATREADYRACVEAGGIYGTDDVGDMTDIADRCYKAVYGE